MRVLMFGWEFPPHQAGGLATATLGLVKGLLRNGVDVTLVVPFPVTGSPLSRLRLLGPSRRGGAGSIGPATDGRDGGRPRGHLRRIPIPSALVPYGAPEAAVRTAVDDVPVMPASDLGNTAENTPDESAGSFRPYGGDLFAEVERFADVAEQIARSEPHDVIDCHDWMTYEAGLRARSATGRPLVVHLHATERDRSGVGGHPEIRQREHQGLNAADRVVCNSRWMRRQIVDEYLVDSDRIDVIPWGIEAAPIPIVAPSPFAPDEPVVLFVGRVTRQKGPEFFVSVAARVAELVPRARFVVAGTGDRLPWMIERVAELGLEDRFHWAGGLDSAEVRQAFRWAWVCVMPSVSEPFGLVALESLQEGTPCILPRGSGAAEVVRHALRADFWDIERMADQVVALLRNPLLREELASRGRNELAGARFALDEPAKLTAMTYHRAMRRGAHD